MILNWENHHSSIFTPLLDNLTLVYSRIALLVTVKVLLSNTNENFLNLLSWITELASIITPRSGIFLIHKLSAKSLRLGSC